MNLSQKCYSNYYWNRTTGVTPLFGFVFITASVAKAGYLTLSSWLPRRPSMKIFLTTVSTFRFTFWESHHDHCVEITIKGNVVDLNWIGTRICKIDQIRPCLGCQNYWKMTVKDHVLWVCRWRFWRCWGWQIMRGVATHWPCQAKGAISLSPR